MKPHKWAKEIKAWADGAEIESKWNNEKEWQIVDKTPQWFTDEGFEYRIKPQQQQSSCCKCQQTCSALKEPQYLYVYMNTYTGNEFVTSEFYHTEKSGLNFKYIGKIKLEDEASSSGED